MKTLSPKSLRAIGNWLRGDNTGISSETMVAISLGATSGNFDAPHDPSDFGRCLRLVNKVPEIRDHFPRIGKKVKEFAGILRHWDDLVRIYERDKASGRSEELYNRIKELRGDRS